MNEPDELVKSGTFLYDNSVICDIRIFKTHFRPGTGDEEDLPEWREDSHGIFFRIEFGSVVKRGEFSSFAYSTSLEEAVEEAKQTCLGLKWKS